MSYKDERVMLETKITKLVTDKYGDESIPFLVGAMSTLCSDDQLLAFIKHLEQS